MAANSKVQKLSIFKIDFTNIKLVDSKSIVKYNAQHSYYFGYQVTRKVKGVLVEKILLTSIVTDETLPVFVGYSQNVRLLANRTICSFEQDYGNQFVLNFCHTDLTRTQPKGVWVELNYKGEILRWQNTPEIQKEFDKLQQAKIQHEQFLQFEEFMVNDWFAQNKGKLIEVKSDAKLQEYIAAVGDYTLREAKYIIAPYNSNFMHRCNFTSFSVFCTDEDGATFIDSVSKSKINPTITTPKGVKLWLSAQGYCAMGYPDGSLAFYHNLRTHIGYEPTNKNSLCHLAGVLRLGADIAQWASISDWEFKSAGWVSARQITPEYRALAIQCAHTFPQFTKFFNFGLLPFGWEKIL